MFFSFLASSFLLRPYDFKSAFGSFFHAICNRKACVMSFFTLSEASFLFMRVNKFLVTRDLPNSQNLLTQSEIFFNSEIRSSEFSSP